MDNVLVDNPSAFNLLDENTRELYEGHLDEVPGIFRIMKPVDGAVETFNQLADLFEVYILSSAPWENPSAWSEKLVWVKKNLGEKAFQRLILSHHKDLYKGDILIDNPSQHDAFDFQGEVIMLGSDRFENWSRIKEYLVPTSLQA